MIVDKLLMLLGISYDPSGAKKADRDVTKLDSHAKKADKSFAGLGTSAAGAFALLGGVGAVLAIGSGLVRSIASNEALETSLVAVTGSAEGASEAMGRLREFAERTPYSIEEVATAFRKLSTLGLEPSDRALESYGNTASAMGKSLDQMVEAVADAAVGEFERLKEFGIKAKKQGDKVSFTFKGVTTTVKNNSEAIQGYLLGIGETDFAGSMDRQSKTLLGRWSTFKDKLVGIAVGIGEEGFSDALKGGLEVLMELGDAVRPLAKALGFLLGLAVQGLITAFKGLKRIGTAVRDGLLDIIPQSFIDRLKTGGDWVKKLGKWLMVAFMPVLIPILLIEDFIAFLQGKDSMIGNFVKRWKGAGGALGMVAKWLGKIADRAFWRGLKDRALGIWTAVRDAVQSVIQAYVIPLIDLVKQKWENLQPAITRVKTAMAALGEVLSPIVDWVKELVSSSDDDLAPVWDKLAVIFGKVGVILKEEIVDAVKAWIVGMEWLANFMLTGFAMAIENATALIKGLQAAWEAIPEAARGAWTDMLSWLEKQINSAIEVVNTMIRAVNKVNPLADIGQIGGVDLTGSSTAASAMSSSKGGGGMNVNSSIGSVGVTIQGRSDMGFNDIMKASRDGAALGVNSVWGGVYDSIAGGGG
uniref:Putative tail tape measure protein n=1 Tax=viral metagenome TaxID=1070528 RepID=A0A6M3LNU9_9ZZZZ